MICSFLHSHIHLHNIIYMQKCAENIYLWCRAGFMGLGLYSHTELCPQKGTSIGFLILCGRHLEILNNGSFIFVIWESDRTVEMHVSLEPWFVSGLTSCAPPHPGGTTQSQVPAQGLQPPSAPGMVLNGGARNVWWVHVACNPLRVCTHPASVSMLTGAQH